ncbi:MAG: hypothetical protein GY822_29400 [Deltaproteobacteria bacterium]|nr:hypothetical protein [Deltaproteobacteria bacterium]
MRIASFNVDKITLPSLTNSVFLVSLALFAGLFSGAAEANTPLSPFSYHSDLFKVSPPPSKDGRFSGSRVELAQTRPPKTPKPTSTTTGAENKPVGAAGEEEFTDTKRFSKGLRSFEFGDCKRVVRLLRPLALPGRVTDQDRLLKVHRMLGVCFLQLNDEAGARAALKALLYLKSDYVLDPFLTPPAVVKIFEEERQEVLRKLDAINRAKEKKEERRTLLIERNTTVEHIPFWTIFLPFGGAQMANDESIKGAVIGGLMGTTLATNVAAFWTVQGICWSQTTQEGTCTYAHDKVDGIASGASTWQNAHTTAQVVSASALGAFVLVYLYSVADGWWNWVPERVVKSEEKEQELTPEDQAARETIP